MKTALALMTLCGGTLWLGACDEKPTPPPPPIVDRAVPFESGAASGPVADPSVPSAASVFTPANAAKAEPTQQPSKGTLSAAQESTAMPMPGQNNDHSTAVGPAQRASSPQGSTHVGSQTRFPGDRS